MAIPLRISPAILTVDRESFKLTYWKLGAIRYSRKTIYPIAVGKLGDATPAGMYHVVAKNERPDWKIPEHEDYPPEIWGSIVPFDDPRNPFAGGFIALDRDGIGMHGTKFDPHLGSRASHGCIRMEVKDLLALFKVIPIGTPTFIY